MTLDDLKALVARGETHVRFPVTWENGIASPVTIAERSLIDAGAIWYQSRDERHRTYAILHKAASLQEGE